MSGEKIKDNIASFIAAERLTAAAPDLLAALKDALEVMGDWDDEGAPGWAQAARAAIAKAEGASQ